MYPWAVNFKAFVDQGMGLTMFAEMLTFVGFMLVGFYYIIKKGALNWE
jgi:NADH-quinone oxidoreductase subunit A